MKRMSINAINSLQLQLKRALANIKETELPIQERISLDVNPDIWTTKRIGK